MKTAFICLANSKKYGERCIAGIILEKNDKNRWREVRDENGFPKWVRPVSNENHGEVKAKLVEHVALFDIVEIDVVKRTPKGYQSENAIFDLSSLQVIEKRPCIKRTLERLITQTDEDLFGNKGKAITKEKINTIQNSLFFIRVQNPVCRFYPNKYQFRLEFDYNDVNYDLPITDIDFLKSRVQKEDEPITLKEQIYICVSIGIEHKDWYYKLVAGIIHNFEE